MSLSKSHAYLRSCLCKWHAWSRPSLITGGSGATSNSSTMTMFCTTATSPKPSPRNKRQRSDVAVQASKSKRLGSKGRQGRKQGSEFRNQHLERVTSSVAERTTSKGAKAQGAKSQLHDELIDFAWRCAPTPASIKLAELSARAIELAWMRGSKGPPIRAVPFGSQPCALALPGGDLDVYVEYDDVRPSEYACAVSLVRCNSPVLALGRLRLTFTKYTEISQVEGWSAGDTVPDDGLALMQACLDAQPQARPLLLALKALVKQEGFNKHQAVTKIRPQPPAFLPPLDTLPQRRATACLQPEELPSRFLPPENARDQAMHERFAYCVLQAASASWHLPPPTPFEQHATVQCQPSNSDGNRTIAKHGNTVDGSWDPWGRSGWGPASLASQGQTGDDVSRMDQGLQQVAFVRSTVKGGPDLGDLLLDLLHRYGKGWSPKNDSVHLRRLDPLTEQHSPMSRGGEMGPNDSIDVADFLSDLESLSDADESDKESALMSLPRSTSQIRKSGRGSRRGTPRTGDALRDRSTHFEILSPFQDEGAAYVNLAGGSSQGRRIGKLLDSSHRNLCKALERWTKKAASGGHVQIKQHIAAASAVQAVVAYLGQLSPEERERVRVDCQQAVRVVPRNKHARNKVKSLQTDLKQGNKVLRRLEEMLKSPKTPRNIQMKLRKRIERQRTRNAKWDSSLQALLSSTDTSSPIALKDSDSANNQGKSHRWGDFLSRDKKESTQRPQKNCKEQDNSEQLTMKMHAVADALAEVLLELREDDIIHQYAQAAATSSLNSNVVGSDLCDRITNSSTLKTALVSRTWHRGPSGTEAWLAGLEGAQLQEVVEYAEAALAHAIRRQCFGCEEGVVALAVPSEMRVVGSTAMPWKWDRARIAVMPDTAYPVLSSVLDVGKALGLPNMAGRARESLEDPCQQSASDDQGSLDEGRQQAATPVGVAGDEPGTTSAIPPLAVGTELSGAVNTSILEQFAPDEEETYGHTSGLRSGESRPRTGNSSGEEHRGVSMFEGMTADGVGAASMVVNRVAVGKRGEDRTRVVAKIAKRLRQERLSGTTADSIGVEEQLDILANKE